MHEPSLRQATWRHFRETSFKKKGLGAFGSLKKGLGYCILLTRFRAICVLPSKIPISCVEGTTIDRGRERDIYICVYTDRCECMCVCMYVCIYVCMYVHMYVSMDLHMQFTYVRMCIYICACI